jgi:hypothetical protein
MLPIHWMSRGESAYRPLFLGDTGRISSKSGEGIASLPVDGKDDLDVLNAG